MMKFAFIGACIAAALDLAGEAMTAEHAFSKIVFFSGALMWCYITYRAFDCEVVE